MFIPCPSHLYPSSTYQLPFTCWTPDAGHSKDHRRDQNIPERNGVWRDKHWEQWLMDLEFVERHQSFFSLCESVGMVAGPCIYGKAGHWCWADTALSHSCCSLSRSACWRKSSCCSQGREARITPPHFIGVLASSDCSQEKGTAPASLLASVKEENWEVKMGTTQPIYEHHKICWRQTREAPLKTWEALANPPHFSVPPILLQVCSTLSRTQRHFLVGKQNERNYSWCFQISKFSQDLMYDTRIGQKRRMQDKSEWL